MSEKQRAKRRRNDAVTAIRRRAEILSSAISDLMDADARFVRTCNLILSGREVGWFRIRDLKLAFDDRQHAMYKAWVACHPKFKVVRGKSILPLL